MLLEADVLEKFVLEISEDFTVIVLQHVWNIFLFTKVYLL